MFCVKCGHELSEGTVFCTECGAKQELEEKGKEQPESKKRRIPLKTGKKIAGVVVGLAVAAAIAGGIFFNQPRTRILRSAQKTYRDIKNTQTGFDKVLGFSDIVKRVAKGESHQEIELQMNSAGGLAVGAGFRAEVSSNRKNGETLAYVFPTFKGNDLFDATLYFGKDKVAVAVPDIYDGYYYFDRKEAIKNYNDSSLNTLIRQIYGIPGSASDLTEEDIKAMNGWMNRSLTAAKPSLKQMYKNAEIKKTGSQSLSIGGKNKKCASYEITFDKKDVKAVLKDFMKAAGSDESLRALFLAWPGNSESDYDGYLNELDLALDEILEMFGENLVIQVCIGPKGRIVLAECEYTFEGRTREDDVRMLLSASMLGKKNPVDEMEISWTISDDYAKYKYELSREIQQKGQSLSDSGECKISVSNSYGGGYSEKISYEANLDKKSGAFDVVVKVPDEWSAKAEGTITGIKKGKSFDLQLDKLRIGSSYGELLSVEGRYAVSPLGKTKIYDPSEGEEQYPLFDLSAAEIRQQGGKILKKLSAKLAGKWIDTIFEGSKPSETTAAPTESAKIETTADYH